MNLLLIVNQTEFSLVCNQKEIFRVIIFNSRLESRRKMVAFFCPLVEKVFVASQQNNTFLNSEKKKPSIILFWSLLSSPSYKNFVKTKFTKLFDEDSLFCTKLLQLCHFDEYSFH